MLDDELRYTVPISSNIYTSTKWQIKAAQLRSHFIQTTHTGRYVQNSFIGVVGQVELQTSSRAQPEPKNTNTCDTTVFYPGEVPFKNQGTSTSPIITEITRNLSQQQTMGKGGKKRGSQKDQVNTQLWPSTSNDGTSTTSVFPPRNTGTGRPHIQCSACGGDDHFRKDCQQDNFL